MDGSKERVFYNVAMVGSTVIESGKTIFNKSPEQEFHVIPIRDTPKVLRVEDTGNIAKITVDRRGKIIYALTSKNKL
mgnify:CR=1 FL=1